MSLLQLEISEYEMEQVLHDGVTEPTFWSQHFFSLDQLRM